MILILFPVIFSRSIHRVCVFVDLSIAAKFHFFLMLIISIKTLVQRVIRGAKFENGSPSFRLFFRCCCWCSSWLFERPKLKRQIKEKLHVIEKIGIQKTREKFSTGWLEKGERKKEERGDRERDKKNNDQKRWHFFEIMRRENWMIKIHETMNNYGRPNTTGLGSFCFLKERGERTEQVTKWEKGTERTANPKK
jgi:hypothetical protein